MSHSLNTPQVIPKSTSSISMFPSTSRIVTPSSSPKRTVKKSKSTSQSVIMFPSKPTTNNTSTSSSPPKRAVSSVKKFVKGFKRRISLIGHRRSSSDHSDDAATDSDGGESGFAAAPPEIHWTHEPAVENALDHSPYLPHSIPLPPSPSSSRTRGHLSDASSQLSAPFSDSQTYASGGEESTLQSVNLPKDQHFEVDHIPLLSPIVEPVAMEVQSPSSPREEGADETVVEHTEAESESNNAEDSDGPSEDRQELVSSEAPEDPNPFLVDDPEEPASSEDGSSAADSEEEGSTPAEEIALAQSVVELPLPATPVTALSAVEAHPLASPVMQVNKPMPPAPASQVVPTVTGSSSSSDEEDEPPTLYISGLTVPTMFLPIPNTDALSTLLAKYIPAEQRPRRDVTGEWQRSDYHTLVMTNSWRALARMARDRIVATDPGEVALLLNLWYVRLSSLARLRLYAQANHEMANLFSVLSPPAAITSSNTLSTQPSGSSVSASTTGTSLSSYPSISSLNLPSMQHRSTLSQTEHEHLRDNLMPFELEVLRAKSKYWEGDHMGYLDELRALLGRCKKMSRRACKGPKGRGAVRDEQAVGMWKERGARVCLIMASQLIEMKDFTAATTLLSSLLSPFSPTSSPRLRAALGRVHLQSGNLTAAADHFTQIAEDPTAPRSLVVINTALLSVAEGNWDKAVTALKGIVDDKDREGNGGIEEKERYVAANNLAVAMLSQGHLKEGILVLEETLKASPSTAVSAEPMLFNLSTLYELRANIVSEKKRELLVEVAKWAGDGLRTTCLKMSAT